MNSAHRIVHGGDGNDCLYGGDGNDTLDGSLGAEHQHREHLDNPTDGIAGDNMLFARVSATAAASLSAADFVSW